MTGFVFDRDGARAFNAMRRDYEAGNFQPTPGGEKVETSAGGVNLYCLLEDLTGVNDAWAISLIRETRFPLVYDIAVVGRLEPEDPYYQYNDQPEAHRFVIEGRQGGEEGGEWEESGLIPWWGSAKDIEPILREMSIFQGAALEVSLGTQVHRGEEYRIARWFVACSNYNLQFREKHNYLPGPTGISITRHRLRVGGAFQQLRSALPVTDPTPFRAGAICYAQSVAGFGLCATNPEARKFALVYDGDGF
ncbi:MAG: hypothetical protein CMJ46_16185 [Planctomyces sp.]|nr:hypothetical protein [Planctomyces sp.]